MKQVYLDTIILRVLENTGNDSDLREDFVRRVLKQRLRDVVPGRFFPITMITCNLVNYSTFIEIPFIDVIAVQETRELPTLLYIVDNEVYDPKNSGLITKDYLTEEDIVQDCRPLKKWDFSVDVMSNKLTVYNEEASISVFLYTPYLDKNKKIVIPQFAEDYLEAYGTMRGLEILLNKGLKGRTPGMVPQTRYTVNEIKKRVTREYLSMQQTISMLSEKVIVKSVNSPADAIL